MTGNIGDARTRRVGAGAGFIAVTVAMVWVAAAVAQTPPIPAELLKERREMALHMLSEAAGELVARTRADCASGIWSSTVSLQRSRGRQQTADTADTCAYALARVANDQGLFTLYERLVVELAGDSGAVQALPAAIGAAVTKGGGVVAVGNQRGAKITPALALDAGFTVAHQKSVKHAAGMPDLATLKPIAERCLAQGESNLALCYSTGFVYGARAVSQLPLVQ